MRARLIESQLYYGWVIVLTLSITQLTSWGVLYYGFGAVMPLMASELGWSRVVLTGAFSLALLITGVAAVPVGHWLDRHGTRALMTAGSIAATLLLLAWSQVTTVIGFYLVWAGIGLAFGATVGELYSHERNRCTSVSDRVSYARSTCARVGQRLLI